MERILKNNKLIFQTTFQGKNIPLYEVELKRNFNHKIDEKDGFTIDTVILNNKYKSVLTMISNTDNFILIENTTEEKTQYKHALISFNETKCEWANQYDNLIATTTYPNGLVNEISVINKVVDSEFIPFFKIPSTFIIHTDKNAYNNIYEVNRLSPIDNGINSFYFNQNLQEIKADICVDDLNGSPVRINRQMYNIGQSDEYVVETSKTGEEYFFYTNKWKNFKHKCSSPKGQITLGILIGSMVLLGKCVHDKDDSQKNTPSKPALIQPYKSPQTLQEQHTHQ